MLALKQLKAKLWGLLRLSLEKTIEKNKNKLGLRVPE